jgi:hypothetical protein
LNVRDAPSRGWGSVFLFVEKFDEGVEFPLTHYFSLLSEKERKESSQRGVLSPLGYRRRASN